MIASGARTDVRKMHHDVQAFIQPVEVALIAPHLEAFARDAFHERGKRREHVQLRLIARQRQTVGQQRRGLLFDAHLEAMRRRHHVRCLADLQIGRAHV